MIIEAAVTNDALAGTLKRKMLYGRLGGAQGRRAEKERRLKVTGMPDRDGFFSKPPHPLTGFGALLRLLFLTLFRARGTAARYTLKRFFVVVFFLPFFLLAQAAHRLALALDNVFFPAFRTVEVRDPVFIVGIHRSGTTYFHHLLSEDTENFTSFRLWELLFAPSILERKFWFAVGAVDRLLGAWGRKALVAIEDRLLKDLRVIHQTGLFEPEEDELVLVPYFASAFLLLPFPFPEKLWALTRFDVDVPLAEQDRVMRHYKQCVQRHLYVHGSDKRFLSKNPLFSAKIEAIRRTFPDARVICNVRQPYEAIPSCISLMSFYWSSFDNDPQGSRLRDMTLAMTDFFYRHPIQRLPRWPRNRHAFLKYDRLIAAPGDAVLELYARLDIPLTPAFDAYLQTQEERMRAFKSRHHYSLERWGLSPERIRTDYGDVFEYFGFNTDHAA